MLVRLRSNLWLMGNTQHLPVFSHLSQHTADDLGGCATDTHIHLIKDQRRGRRALGNDDLNSQTDARQLTTGSHLGQRSWRLARVGGHQKFDAFQSLGGHCALGNISQFDPEFTFRHSQQGDAFTNQFFQFSCRTLAFG